MGIIDLEGTYRSRTPQETLDWISPFLKHFGITRVADITGLDSIGIYVYQAIRPYSKSLTVSQGKGVSRELAKISCIMESIELWHAENIRPPDLIGSFSELRKHYPVVLPTNNRYASLVSNQNINWIQATDLFSGQDAYLPYDLFNLDFSMSSTGFFSSTSNGLASGNTFEEALCHGLYEVIERDAIAKARRRGLLKYPIDLQSLKSYFLTEMKEKLDQEGVCTLLLDITSELEIPSYICYILGAAEIRPSTDRHCGYGCHLSKEVAVSRALTEAVQTRLTVINGTRDDLHLDRYVESQNALSSLRAMKEGIRGLSNLEELGPPIWEIPETFDKCIGLLLSQLQKHGYKEAYFVDHTRHEFGIPVVHVYVNGLKFSSGGFF